MIIVNLVLIFSFFLDGIIAHFIKLNSLFLPLCSIIALIIIFPYFKKNTVKYLKYCGIFGLFYGLVYLDKFLIGIVLFILIGLAIKLINIWLSNNVINVFFMSLIAVILYRLSSYIFFLIFNYSSFNLFLLFKSIYSSLILNIIYGIILYIITNKLSKKYRISKID